VFEQLFEGKQEGLDKMATHYILSSKMGTEVQGAWECQEPQCQREYSHTLRERKECKDRGD
jgi:hypothetical protein